MKRSSLLLFCAAFAFAAEAQASEIIFRGINPDITPTANPNNEASVSALASLTRPAAAPTATPTLSESQLLQQSIISGLSNTYQQLLTGANSGSGTLNLGDGNSAVYSTLNGVRYITFYNADGTSTQISFPIS